MFVSKGFATRLRHRILERGFVPTLTHRANLRCASGTKSGRNTKARTLPVIPTKRILRKFVLKCLVFIPFARHLNYEILPGLRLAF